jgi:hypothetical protein
VKDTDIIAAIAPDAVSLMDKAIAEIKRLRQENATLTAEHDALRAERDEARQEICRNEADLISLELGGAAIFAASVAKRRGWDCFRETMK